MFLQCFCSVFGSVFCSVFAELFAVISLQCFGSVFDSVFTMVLTVCFAEFLQCLQCFSNGCAVYFSVGFQWVFSVFPVFSNVFPVALQWVLALFFNFNAHKGVDNVCKCVQMCVHVCTCVYMCVNCV